MEPGPEFASPPEMDQVTLAAAPSVVVAENCSAAPPEELAELQPVQLVSTVTELGEIANSPLDDPLDEPPELQPASAKMVGKVASAKKGIGRRDKAIIRPLPDFEPRRRCSAVTDPF